jgi:hypothetical protein
VPGALPLGVWASCWIKKLLHISNWRTSRTLAGPCLLQQQPPPRPIPPETAHGKYPLHDQAFDAAGTQSPSRRRNGFPPARHVERPAGSREQPSSIVHTLGSPHSKDRRLCRARATDPVISYGCADQWPLRYTVGRMF